MKYVIDNYDNDEYRGFTDLYGMEVRHDLGNKWDLGVQGSMYNSHNSELSDYSYGLSVGYNMARNVWVSLGYNFSGFEDEDFTASEYTSEGLFLKYRLKFDQNTASSILGLMDR
jgi:opacity protein-like surface antigen